ncbi:oxidoreductase [Streptomyces sp. NPDC001893]|uniref:oxidoreductase n=1 Tax=Streptomyces sp. NPDC001893 TaxID=3154530 RepID=UPI003325890C
MSPEHPTAGRGKDGVGATVAPPGTVDTPFRDKRGGTPEAAPAMTAEHIADTIVFVVNQPAGVGISHITMRPAGQVG